MEFTSARRKLGSIFAMRLAFVICALSPIPAHAQVRGVYPLGMTATNSGVTPESGFTYANQFLFYSRSEFKGEHGEVLATGQNSVIMDMNSFVWVSKAKIGFLGGAVFSASATLPVANNSLSSDIEGALSGGGGFADSYYQPFILGWRAQRADVRAIYGLLAPTGRFAAGTDTNVGSGYWTHALASGQTFYLTQNRATAFSAFELYEIHTTQEGTHIHPGQTFNLDYSFAHVLQMKEDTGLQLGLVGYEQFQTTNRTGPNISPIQANARYRVNALGVGANVLLPRRKTTLGARYFKEFSGRSTFQGYSVQISGAITF